MVEKKSRPKKNEAKEEEKKPRIEKLDVWTVVRHGAPKSCLDFTWPEFKNDRERIKFMSNRFKDKSIVEAFESTGAEISKNIDEIANMTPMELSVGQIIPARISRVTKNGVIFSRPCVKQNLVCNTNLYKYEKFREFLPTNDIQVRVVSVDRNRVVVDPITPIFDQWIEETLKDVDLQKNINAAKTIQIKNLHLTRGGFVGKAVIPSVSKFVGDTYTIDAFIPGSQIVLNIEKDFSKWEGKTVDAFVSNYIVKPGTVNEMSLICSVKEYLKFQGDQYLIKLFSHYCDNGEWWKQVTAHTYNGVVTGVINSAKKCGVFVEIPEYHVTGMISMKPDEIVHYKPQQSVDVRIVDFEENTYYDSVTKQTRHNEPYKIENDILRECSLKPVLKLV